MKRALTGGAAIAGLALFTSGCAWFEEEEEDLDFDQYAGQLTDMFNESARLNGELDVAEARIVQDCLEEAGFTVHNPDPFHSWDSAESETFMDQGPYEWFVPTVEEAELRGVWQWTNLEGAESIEDGVPWEAYQEYEDAQGFDVTLHEEGEEAPEFYNLSPEDQYAWWVAYQGEELAASQQGYLVGIELETDEYGEPVDENPPPGGCELEMITALYGEVEEVDNPEEEFSNWVTRPPMPNGDWSAMNERYVERTADFEDDFLDCLEDRGFGGWEFYEGHVRIHDYLAESGEGEFPRMEFEDADGAWPDPAQDVPDSGDTAGWLAFERDAAVQFAECGEESGYREAAVHAWEQAQLRYYLDIEEETYGWQESMRGFLEKAQEIIES
ncbi:hypothetical protein [Glycomyces buryatensis]|uniref:Uncharacterized protein n=1 Tax=Glycomyces buryatensis TaxID=2570927 RepID=A0A4S8PRL2_9ACTN|nr:hypothetical protein [Glycomyces buryatensis]THV33903.1 hypothetical protein FAB82_24720 [Glycomyces buryatensis]